MLRATAGLNAAAIAQQQVLLQSGIPFVVPSGATVSASAGLTSLTALPYTSFPVPAYFYCPSGYLSTGSAAGWYYASITSATAATVFNNTYTSGTPSIPASPTAFSGLSGGSGTQVTGSNILGPNVTMAAGQMGVNGELNYSFNMYNNNSANVKTLSFSLGGSSPWGIQNATNTTLHFENYRVVNRGSAASQVFVAGNPGQSTQAPITSSINTAAAQVVGFTLQLNTAATDTIVLDCCSIRVFPTTP